MLFLILNCCFVIFYFDYAAAINQQTKLVVVAQDGSGDFKNIQSAIDAVKDFKGQKIIYIKNGIYPEKLFITCSNINFIGDDKDSTIILFAQLRSSWVDSTGDDWGAGAINIGNGTEDIKFINLTVYNNYGSLYGNNDHQFAVRSFDADKIIFINCSLKADGGDTVALWNADSGKYYLSNCTFDGFVDFVCPRGWCYITNSIFFQKSAKASASIWHDGGADINSKLVIKNSRFEGVDSFSLGRHHRDAQFYLINCTFAENMRNRPIYFNPSNPPKPYKWGERYYYFNTHKEGGDYEWHNDNLTFAKDSPQPSEITSVWTFSTAPVKWNPHESLNELKNILNELNININFNFN